MRPRIAAAAAAFLVAGAVTALARAQVPPSPLPVPTPPSPASPSPSTAALGADEIFSKAEARLRGHESPPFMSYLMHEIFVHHGKRSVYDYRVWYRSDGKGLMQNQEADRRGRRETFFQYPFPLAPDINILLYATPAPASTPPPPQGTPAPLPPGATPPPVIGVQPVVANRYYSIALAGIEDYQGHPVYHLELKPLLDERSHPLKDVWVDTQTFEIWKAHVRAAGTLGPLTGNLEAVASFAPVGNFWMVKELVADGQGHIGFISDSGHYEYYFSEFDFPATIPDWYFDPKQFGRHISSK